MIVASAGSFFFHIHGVSLVALLVWWVVWAVLWVLWGRFIGSLVGAFISLAVLGFMLVGPRTDLAFNLHRDCFDATAQAALAAHAPEPNRNVHYHGEDNCGLMTFTVETRFVRFGRPGEPMSQEPELAVVFPRAGELTWGLASGHGMIFSPQGAPRCAIDFNIAADGCSPERVGASDWYYYTTTGSLG